LVIDSHRAQKALRSSESVGPCVQAISPSPRFPTFEVFQVDQVAPCPIGLEGLFRAVFKSYPLTDESVAFTNGMDSLEKL